MFNDKVLKILTAIAITATVVMAQMNIIYRNDFNSLQSLDGWELYDISISAEDNGRLEFGQEGAATMPQLPADGRNMAVHIQANYPSWIYLYTSVDGVRYNSNGVFNDTSKKILNGTRFVRFVAKEGTNNDIYLISVRVRGDIAPPPNRGSGSGDIGGGSRGGSNIHDIW